MNRLLSLALVLLLAVPAFAQDADSTMTDRKGVNGKAESMAAMTSPQALAVQLAQYGRATDDAQALATAAQLLLDHPAAPLDGEVDTETMTETMDDGGPVGDKADDSVSDFTAVALLAEAAALAEADSPLAGLIEDLQAQAAQPVPYGRVGGSLLGVYRVSAYGTNTHYLSFRGGQRATIAITGDHDSDLDFYLYDENGNLVASDTDYTDVGYFSFRPLWTGPFRLRVRNLGNVYNEYVLSTN
ncbi:MAG: hypothetical protein AAFU51_03240 [Bacteroidota bacterium]